MRAPVFLLAVLVLGGCGDVVLSGRDAGPGKTCFADTDCAPNGCCGMGDAVVHVSDAPDCSQAVCTGTCPKQGIKCGCAVPVCRDQRCTAALATDC